MPLSPARDRQRNEWMFRRLPQHPPCAITPANDFRERRTQRGVALHDVIESIDLELSNQRRGLVRRNGAREPPWSGHVVSSAPRSQNTMDGAGARRGGAAGGEPPATPMGYPVYVPPQPSAPPSNDKQA